MTRTEWAVVIALLAVILAAIGESMGHDRPSPCRCVELPETQ